LISLVNTQPNAALYYWRENGVEIDYLIEYGKQIIGVEVKIGDESIPAKTADKFTAYFPNAKLILVGKHGIPYEVFMKTDLDSLIPA
jgi:predicted AAA+ superfamily ATPase